MTIPIRKVHNSLAARLGIGIIPFVVVVFVTVVPAGMPPVPKSSPKTPPLPSEPDRTSPMPLKASPKSPEPAGLPLSRLISYSRELEYITKERLLASAGRERRDLKFFFSPFAHLPALIFAVPISLLFVLSITLILNEKLSKSKPELFTTEKL